MGGASPCAPSLVQRRRLSASRRRPSYPPRSCSIFVRPGHLCSPGVARARSKAEAWRGGGTPGYPEGGPAWSPCALWGRPGAAASRATWRAAPACSLLAAFRFGLSGGTQLCRCMTRSISAICKHVHTARTCGSTPVETSSSAARYAASALESSEGPSLLEGQAMSVVAAVLVKIFSALRQMAWGWKPRDNSFS